MRFAFRRGCSTPAGARGPAKQCGFERWPVKILSDKDRQRLDLQPRDATVQALIALRRPRSGYAYDRRVRPVELQTFGVQAVIVRIKLEQDSDLHLVIADPANRRLEMIAEVPHPDCAIGSGHEEEYRRVRQALRAIPAGARVQLVGAAFFDRAHGQAGAAPNRIELHPLLDVKPIPSGIAR